MFKTVLLLASTLLVSAEPIHLEKRTAENTAVTNSLPDTVYAATTYPDTAAELAAAITAGDDWTYSIAAPGSSGALTFFTGTLANGEQIDGSAWAVGGSTTSCTGNFGLYKDGTATSYTSTPTDGFQFRAKGELDPPIRGPAAIVGKLASTTNGCTYTAQFGVSVSNGPFTQIDEPYVVGGDSEVTCANIDIETPNTNEQTLDTDTDTIEAALLTFDEDAFDITAVRYVVSTTCDGDAIDANFTISFTVKDEYDAEVANVTEVYHTTSEDHECIVGYVDKHDLGLTDADLFASVRALDIVITADEAQNDCTYLYHFDYFTTGINKIQEPVNNGDYATCDTLEDVSADYPNRGTFKVTADHVEDEPYYIFDGPVTDSVIGFIVTVNGTDADGADCIVYLQSYYKWHNSGSYNELESDQELDGCTSSDPTYIDPWGTHISLSLYGDYSGEDYCEGHFVIDFLQASDENDRDVEIPTCDTDYPEDAHVEYYPNIQTEEYVVFLNATFDDEYAPPTRYIDIYINLTSLNEDEPCDFSSIFYFYNTLEDLYSVSEDEHHESYKLETCLWQRLTLTPEVKHIFASITNDGADACDANVIVAFNGDEQCGPDPAITTTLYASEKSTTTVTVDPTPADNGKGSGSAGSSISAGMTYLIVSALAAWAMF